MDQITIIREDYPPSNENAIISKDPVEFRKEIKGMSIISVDGFTDDRDKKLEYVF